MPTDTPPTTSLRCAWAVLLCLYLVLALTFSVIQPLGRTPDEAAHVTYVSFLASNLQLPIWSPQGGGEGGYEAQHPPLYYAAMAAVYRLSAPLAEEWRWHLMRWFTILLVGVPMFVICRRFFTEVWAGGGAQVPALQADGGAQVPALQADGGAQVPALQADGGAQVPALQRGEAWYPLIATATVMLMPLLLLYTAYINPDAMAMLWATLALWLAWRRRAGLGAKGLRGAAVLGLVAGLAALSKVSGAPALVLALLACVGTAEAKGVTRTGKACAEERCNGTAGEGAVGRYRVAWAEAAVTLVAFLLTCGWWYGRNAFLYGTPLIHTEGMMGSALHAAARSGFVGWAWLTWKETYLSSWVQRGWFPVGFWTVLLYGIIIVATLGAIAGLVRGKLSARRAAPADGPSPNRPAGVEGPHAASRGGGIRPTAEKAGRRRADAPAAPPGGAPALARERLALNYSGLLLLLVFLGHQWAYWTVDLEFNAGGRYILVAMMALSMLLVTGLRKLLGQGALPALWAWTVALLLMNQVSIWCVWTVLNPRYAPGWKIFHFPS